MARKKHSWQSVSGYGSVRGALSSASSSSLEVPKSPQSLAEASLSLESRSTFTQGFSHRTFDEGQNDPVPSAGRSYMHNKPSPPASENRAVHHVALPNSPRYPTRNPASSAVSQEHIRTNIEISDTTRQVIRYAGEVAKRQIRSTMKGAKTRNPYLREMAKLANEHVAANVLPYDWQRARRDAGDLPEEDPMIISVSGKIVQRGQKELAMSIYDSLGRNDHGSARHQSEWVNGVEVVDLTGD